jgi:4-hydroxyphenylpyruvate dioxygenase
VYDPVSDLAAGDGELLLSIATVSISGSLEGKLQAIAGAGFDGVEIFENDLLSYPGSAGEVGRIVADLGMRCTLFQPFRDFEGMPPELRQRGFDRAERKFDVMAELGTDLMLVCSNVSAQATADRARIVEDFGELAERAGKRGLRVGYEALAWGRFIFDHRDAWAVVRELDRPALGLVLDSFHSLARGIPLDSLKDIDPSKIFIVQLADAPRLDMNYLAWSRHFRCLPGQGDLPVTPFVRTLREAGYQGALSLEIFNDRFRAGAAARVALDGIRSLRLVLDETRPAADAGARPALPPRIRCSGVEFIEFAVSDDEAVELEAMLRTLGFVQTGRHRSKQVHRWQLGDVNLVINSDAEGLARAHNLVHGPSVCAICLRVDDVASALARSQALSIQTYRSRIGPGEMEIPAIRDPGGTLVYLVRDGLQQQGWESDFEPSGVAQAGDGPPGVGVDHVGYATSDEDLPTWLLYYIALFEVRKGALVETADPLGMTETQAIESEDRKFRILLNTSASPQTLASRLVRKYWGAGVQKIGLMTSDIFASARALQELGMERLEIPRNYYDDIEVRFALARDFVDRLAAHSILYDADAGGEYLQLISRAFEKRFFFEFVQREGADGYGAANDPIRLAAQSRFKDDVPI